MFKKRWGKKMLALGLATALTLSNLMPISGGSTLAYAASAYEKVNLLKNPTFEEETPFSPANSTSQAGNWYYWKETKRTKEDAHEGTHCAKLAKTNAALEQDIPDLQVGMTYVYSAWARLSEESDTAKHYIGVKNHGGSEIRVEIESTDWQLYTLEFTCTSDYAEYVVVHKCRGATEPAGVVRGGAGETISFTDTAADARQINIYSVIPRHALLYEAGYTLTGAESGSVQACPSGLLNGIASLFDGGDEIPDVESISDPLF